jgi:hypothetical protein
VKEALQFRAITQHKVRARSRERERSPRAQKEREQLRASLQEQGTLATACVRIRADNLASIFGEGTLSAFGGLEQNAIALVLGGGEFIVIPNITFLVNCSVTGYRRFVW